MLNKVKILTASTVAVMLLSGCTANNSSVSADAQTIYIKKGTTFSKDSQVASNIKQECNLPAKMDKFLKVYGAKNNINFVNKKNPSAKDTVLTLNITGAYSAGNAFTGHRKYVSIAGKLTKNGKTFSSYKAARKSGGGFMGGYKGSCSVLGGSVKRLARDTAEWAVTKQNKARLGDTYLIK